jgi:hypothetical protein
VNPGREWLWREGCQSDQRLPASDDRQSLQEIAAAVDDLVARDST